MSTNGTGPGVLAIGGIPIIWFLIMCCALIVIGICAMSYPLILLNRWRMKERIRAENDDFEEDEEEYEPPPPKQKKGGGSIFGKGRASTRGAWKERTDPSTGQPYFEHTGTGEVTWTDPRPQKMRGKNTRVGNQAMAANSGMMMGGPQGYSPQMGGPPQGYGAPGGFGGAPPPMGGMPPPQGGMPPPSPGMGGMPPPGPPGMGMQAPPPQSRAPPPAAPAPAAPAPAAPAPAAPAPAPAAPAADPKFDKYARMQKAGLPEGAIRNAMNRDGISDAEQKTFFG